MDTIVNFLYIIPAALIAIVLHELSHGLMSYWLGDPTPKEMGRLTLNPIHHLDPIGTICMIFFHFGWAKPVMVDPSYYKNRKWGMALTALAGPLMNFILVIVSFIMILIILLLTKNSSGSMAITSIFINFFNYLAILNIGLGIFNLIPIPPLDGSKIIGVLLPEKAYNEYMGFQRYGLIFFMALMVLSTIIERLGIPSPLEYIINAIYNLGWEVILNILY